MLRVFICIFRSFYSPWPHTVNSKLPPEGTNTGLHNIHTLYNLQSIVRTEILYVYILYMHNSVCCCSIRLKNLPGLPVIVAMQGEGGIFPRGGREINTAHPSLEILAHCIVYQYWEKGGLRGGGG